MNMIGMHWEGVKREKVGREEAWKKDRKKETNHERGWGDSEMEGVLGKQKDHLDVSKGMNLWERYLSAVHKLFLTALILFLSRPSCCFSWFVTRKEARHELVIRKTCDKRRLELWRSVVINNSHSDRWSGIVWTFLTGQKIRKVERPEFWFILFHFLSNSWRCCCCCCCCCCCVVVVIVLNCCICCLRTWTSGSYVRLLLSFNFSFIKSNKW